jgi:hypothetical protein
VDEEWVSSDEEELQGGKKDGTEGVMDLEDLGKVLPEKKDEGREGGREEVGDGGARQEMTDVTAPREMLTPLQVQREGGIEGGREGGRREREGGRETFLYI